MRSIRRNAPTRWLAVALPLALVVATAACGDDDGGGGEGAGGSAASLQVMIGSSGEAETAAVALVLWVSFTDWNGTTNPLEPGGARSVGTDNFTALLADDGLLRELALATLPIAVIYVFFSRYFTRSIATTGIK